ncbi:hypothetical protein, partial [Mesorhizobium sp.]|uniref:hypothetical protein n=1 Tax=Mesorhizobium sp. TaxID=1871066 RepID=UPI0025BAB09A
HSSSACLFFFFLDEHWHEPEHDPQQDDLAWRNIRSRPLHEDEVTAPDDAEHKEGEMGQFLHCGYTEPGMPPSNFRHGQVIETAS